MKARAILTPWFPPEVKPVRPGVYIATTLRRERYFRYWTGTAWLTGGSTVQEAEAERLLFCVNPEQMHWRGLASDPSGSAA